MGILVEIVCKILSKSGGTVLFSEAIEDVGHRVPS